MSAPDARTTGSDSLLALMRRGWPLIVAGTVAGVVLAVLWTLLQSPVYRATATVLVTPTGVQNSADLANGRTNSEINLDTEARLLRSTEVADRVKETLGSNESSFALADRVEVTVPPNTEVLAIAYQAGTPAAAQQGAHAFALAYLLQRASTAQKALDEQVSKADREAAALNTTLKGVSAKLVTLPNASPDRAYTSAQRSLLTEQLSALNQLLGRLTTTVVTPGRLLTDSQVPSSAVSPSVSLNVAGGLALGLILGLLAAWVRGRYDTRMQQAAQVERALGIPVVAAVPAVSLEAPEPPRSPAGEAYRRLANTLPAVLEGSSGVVLVASATPGVAGDVVAANLSTALARTGAAVTLVQVDRESYFCSHLLGADKGGGTLPPVRVWSTEGGVVAPRYVRQTVSVLPGLSVVSALPAGTEDPPAVDDSGRGVVEQLRYRGGFLVIAAPPISSGADAQALAGNADAVILAVELGTPQERAAEALAQFDDVRAPVLGAVTLPPVRIPADMEPAEPPDFFPIRIDEEVPSSAGGNGTPAWHRPSVDRLPSRRPQPAPTAPTGSPAAGAPAAPTGGTPDSEPYGS